MDRSSSSEPISEKGFFTPAAHSIDAIDPREMLGNLWARKNILFTIITVLMVLTSLILFQLTPRYTAESLIMIESRGSHIVDLESVLAGLSTDQETIKSEIEVIQSRGLAGEVVDQLDLIRNPQSTRRRFAVFSGARQH